MVVICFSNIVIYIMSYGNLLHKDSVCSNYHACSFGSSFHIILNTVKSN